MGKLEVARRMVFCAQGLLATQEVDRFQNFYAATVA